MAYTIGMNIVEVDGLGAPAIQSAATSVTAFNILTRRGTPNSPTRVSSFQKFTDQFGSYFAGGLGAYMVKGFFDNGGRTAYINRIVASDATPASIMLSDPTLNTLQLEAGFRGQEDPGSWGNDLYAGVAESSSASSRLQETAAAEITSDNPLGATTDMSALPPLEVLVDGETTATVVTFVAADFPDGPANATREQIRDAINSKTTKLEASISGADELVLTSTGEVAALEDDWTSLQVSANNAPLEFSIMGAAVFGTPAAFAGTETTLARVDGFKVGDAVRITDGAEEAVVKLVRVVSASGVVEWGTAIGNPGDYTPRDIEVSTVEFDLTIAKGGTEDENVVEEWTGLSMEPDVDNYAAIVLNDEIRGSKYVVATDQDNANGAGANVPVDLALTRFTTQGNDGAAVAGDFIGSEANRTGFYAFDPYNVQLVCCERTDSSIVTTALGYCAGRGDCMYIGSVPEGLIAAGQAVAYGQAFQGKKVYGALYGPYIKIFDPAGTGENPVKFIPPSGHVAGVYARIEQSRGIHKAPAGDEANVVGALDVAYRLSAADHDDLVRNGSINGIRVSPGAGIVVDASRTLSTDTRWLYVNVRLLFNYVKSSLLQGLTWVRQEPNTDRLWRLVKFNSVTPFLLGLYRRGAFGTGSPEEVFTVICDASNNPPEEVDQGNFKIEIYFYPSKPAETIIIIVGQQPSGGAAAEA